MYPGYLRPTLVNTLVMPGTIYSQQLPPPPPFMPLRLIPQPVPPPAEPLPSATDVPHALDLPLPQLAEFASAMAVLMWHERQPSILAMHSASRSSSSFPDPAGTEDKHQRQAATLITNAASHSFKNFSRQILQATQLSESVVMLSLKYIAMAIHLNPSIHGADGSEYRVFTVALMLANKYLDDNTFTNKTWSEVTSMSLVDINSMETEFLDVLQYNLFVDKDEFGRWKTALVQFQNRRHQDHHRYKPTNETIMSIRLPPPPPPPTQRYQDQHQQQQQQQRCRHYTFSKQPQFGSTPPIQQTPTRVPLRIPPPSSSSQGKYVQASSYHTKNNNYNDDVIQPLLSESPPYPYRRNNKEDATASTSTTAFLSYNAPPAGQYVPTYPSYHHQDYLSLAPAMGTHYATRVDVPPVYGPTYYIDPSAYAIPVIPSYPRRSSAAASSNDPMHHRH